MWLVLIAVLVAAHYQRQPPVLHRPDPVEEEPPPVITSAYRNAQSGVAYVGDEACADCHDKETRSYKKHPMARSLAPVADFLDRERLDAKADNPFKALGYQMRVERRGQKLLHIEALKDEAGKLVAELETEVQYVLGSGAQGRSYFINRDGRLYQSSISWFNAKQGWGLAPGYETQMVHFFRPIQEDCLFCHVNRAALVRDSLNRYEQPIFRGYAIGCERCHGPGELHVKEGGGRDNIINPEKLEHSLREAICQQCHLQGEARILRRGRDTFDYRPGVPLQAVWSIFVRPPEATDGRRSVSAVEQMYLSRCFRESKGAKKLGCISCHDPHNYPTEENKVAYYRGRCLTCHQDSSCRLTPDERKAKDPQDSCFGCHMPRASSSNIIHAATTDHRIVRSADKLPPPPQIARRGLAPLIDFHREFTGLGEGADLRDLGMALASAAGKSRGRTQQELAGTAWPLLKTAVAKAPSDVPAWEALGYTHWVQHNHEEAKAALDAVLARAPRREKALELAAQNAADLGNDDGAIALWQRLIALDPDHPLAHQRLAKSLGRKEQWQKARDACAVALRINPFNLETRMLLVYCLVKNGDGARASAEFKTLLAMNPPEKEKLNRWFDELTP
jgi:Tfp pilus assembly protein PilF